ncbi:hypothetical protein ABG067_007915 [Albugo candida]
MSKDNRQLTLTHAVNYFSQQKRKEIGIKNCLIFSLFVFINFCFTGSFLQKKWKETINSLEEFKHHPVNEVEAKRKWEELKEGINEAKEARNSKATPHNYLGLTEEDEYFAACSFYLYYKKHVQEKLMVAQRIAHFRKEMRTYDKSMKAYENSHEGVIRPTSLLDERFTRFAERCKRAIEEKLLTSISSVAQGIQLQRRHMRNNGGQLGHAVVQMRLKLLRKEHNDLDALVKAFNDQAEEDEALSFEYFEKRYDLRPHEGTDRYHRLQRLREEKVFLEEEINRVKEFCLSFPDKLALALRDLEAQPSSSVVKAPFSAGLETVLWARLAEEAAWAEKTLSYLGSLTETPAVNAFFAGRLDEATGLEEEDTSLSFDVEEANEASLSAALQVMSLANM